MKPRALLVLLGLALGAAGLFALDAHLDARAAEQRGSALRLRPLVTAEQAGKLAVAALRLSWGDGSSQFYARSEGVWRCLSWHGALASEAGVGALVSALLDAVGTLDPLPDEQVRDWGFDTDDTLTITLHGTAARMDTPALDQQLRVEIGLALPAIGACFARRPGEPGVLALDVDLRALVPRDGELPPLIDRTLLGAATLPPGQHFTDVLVRAPGKPPVRLTERPSSATEEELRRGASPYVHVLVDEAGQERYTVGPLVGSFQVFLLNARWQEQLDPRRAAEFGIGNDSPRVALKRSDGQTFGLLLGVPRDDGRVPVLNTASGQLALVGPDVAGALQPAPDDFLPGAPRNLWDAWLRN